jgi:uncharacterized protein YecT (DUF1311 family)
MVCVNWKFLSAVLCGLLFGAMPFAWGQEEQLVDWGKTKIVPFSASEDGRLAVGWTIRPARKNVKPVDWSLWSAEDTDDVKFFGRYPWDQSMAENPSYELVEVVADLKTRKFVEIDSGDKTGLDVIWSGAVAGGRRYGLLGKWHHRGSTMLTLVVEDKAGLRTVDLLGGAEAAVDDFASERAPNVNFSGTFFTLVGIEGNTAWVEFSAENFDNHDEDAEGILTMRLPDGAVRKVDGLAADDLIKSDAALAKADAMLNNIYGKLLKRLDAAGRQALKNEQRDWIERRDSDATDAGEKPQNKTAEEVREAKVKSLLDATRRRTAELQKRLKAAN